MQCDSLGKTIGAVLMQEGRPFPSKVERLKENNYSKLFMKRKYRPYYMWLQNDDLT